MVLRQSLQGLNRRLLLFRGACQKFWAGQHRRPCKWNCIGEGGCEGLAGGGLSVPASKQAGGQRQQRGGGGSISTMKGSQRVHLFLLSQAGAQMPGVSNGS